MTPQKAATGETSLPKSLTLKEFSEYFFGAAASRSVASTVFLPLTVVKTRFEAMGSTRPYTSTWNAIVFIQKIEGWRSLWSGLWPTLLRDVPHSALYYSIYNHLKRVLHPLRKNDSKIPIGFYNLAAGVSAGLIATLTNHPFDVIRTRTQTQFGNQKPLGMVKMTARIVKVRTCVWPLMRSKDITNILTIPYLYKTISPDGRMESFHERINASTYSTFSLSCLHMDLLRRTDPAI